MREGKANVGQTADPADWRIARTIFVADDDATRCATRRATREPLPLLLAHDGQKMRFSGRQIVFKAIAEQDDLEITEDLPRGTARLYGTVDRVVDQILELRESRATSARSSTPAWIGWIPGSPGARWSSWRPR